MPNSKHSVFARPRLSAQGSKRNPFDLSHKRAFHASLGEILPIFHMEVPAGAYVEINETNQTYNMNPIVRPAFSRLKEHIDYFAIPKVQLWSLYDNFITGQSQFMSSALSKTFMGRVGDEHIPQEVPTFNGEFLIPLLKYAYSQSNPFGVSQLNGVCKLLDLLGYGNYYRYIKNAGDADDVESFLTQAGVDNNMYMNFWNLLAFQKVYYSYYRNSQYESNCVEAFNLDWISNNDSAFHDDSYVTELYKVFEPHFRWLKKDYFMSVKPSVLPTSSEIGFDGLNVGPQQGMTVTAGTQNSTWQVFSIPGLGQRSIFNSSTSNASLPQNNGQYVGQGSFTGGSGQNAGATVNVSALRFAFAYDKLLRRMREAGATFDDQMLAQFGIKPVDQRHGDAFWLGGFTNRLNINEVTQTGLGQDITALGQFGANISKFSANNNTIKYHAKEDCVILGIYSTTFDADYASSRYERDNLRRYRFDYYNPAFEDLGCQPVYRGELSMLEHSVPFLQGLYVADSTENTKLLGYVKRYLDYKTKVDTVNGLLAYDQLNDAMQAWTTQYKPFKFGDGGTIDIMNFVPLGMDNLLVNPCVMNDICTSDYNGSWENDHFLVNLFNDVRMMANMSIDGENF